MTYSKLSFPAVSGQQTYDVTFPALAKDHVKASVDGLEVSTFTITGDYKNGSGQITFSAPTFAGGEAIVIWRETGTVPLVDYQGGSSVTERDLDLDAAQALYLHEEQTQEVADTYQPLSDKGQPGGYAELDANGLVPRDQLGTGAALSTTYLAGDGAWKPVSGGGGGGGDVTSPGVGTVSAGEVALFGNDDGTVLQGSTYTPADLLALGNATGLLPAGQVSGLATVATTGLYSDLLSPPSIPANLFDLGDVGGAAPNDGEALVWDAGNSRWTPGVVGGGGGDLTGPISSTADAIAVWSDASGDDLRNSAVKVDTNGDLIMGGGDILLDAGGTVDGVDVSVLSGSVTAIAALTPTADQKAAMDSAESPSGANPFVTNNDSRLTTFVGDDGVNQSPPSETSGLVPAPAHGDWDTDKKFLAADGTWRTPSLGDLSGNILIAQGGTSATYYADAFYNLAPFGAGLGAIIVRGPNAAAGQEKWEDLPVGINGQILTADSTAALGVKWATPAGGGDVLSPGVGSVAVDEIAAFANVDGDVLKGTGISVADIPSVEFPVELSRVTGGLSIDRQHKTMLSTGFTQRVQLDSWNGTTVVEDATYGEFLRLTTNAVTYSENPLAPQPSGACGPLWLHQQLFKPKLHLPWAFRFVFKAPNSTNAQLYAGLFNYNPTLDISATAGRQHLVFYTSGSGASAVRSYSGGGIEDVTVGPSIPYSGIVVLDYIARSVGGGDYEVDVVINGTPLVTLDSTNNLPGYTGGLTTPYALTPAIRMRNTAANSRSFDLQSIKFYYTTAL